MPRTLIFGSGSLLINVDECGDIRDLYWPYVGQYNHLNGHRIRFGVRFNGRFSWLADPGWDRHQSYEPGCLVGRSTYVNEALGLEVHITEAVGNGGTYARQFNFLPRGDSGEVELYVSHDLRIAENDVGDTALYYAAKNCLVHYKHDFNFAFGGSNLTSFATGLKAFKDFVGTWTEAPSGHLNGNPISQGSVDSTLCITANCPGSADYWMTIAPTLDSVERGNPAHILEEARQAGISLHEDDLINRSLLVIRAQSDQHGAILAATDSDILETNRATYCFCWPRDGALVARAVERNGLKHVAEAYFDFCVDLITPERPFFLHKYAPDATLGASWHPWVRDGKPVVPYQQDETSLTLLALCEYEGELKPEWKRMLTLMAEFCRDNVDESGLPLPSYDLWEERFGVHTYTVASTVAALRLAERYVPGCAAAAERMFASFKEKMVDGPRIARRIDEFGNLDWTVDSAILSLIEFDVWVDSSIVDLVERNLRCQHGIDGIARYEHDYYFRQTEEFPGSVWIITSMWFAKALSKVGRADESAYWWEWVQDRASSAGLLSEQFHPKTGEPLSVMPLTWSHAEVIDFYCRFKASKSSR